MQAEKVRRRIAAVQMAIQFESPTANLSTAKEWIRQAKKNQAELVLFPEMSFTGFSMHAAKIASDASWFLSEMQTEARVKNMAIGFGFAAADMDGCYRNHFVVLDENGEILTDFAKIHPFSYCGEDRVYTGGNQIVTGVWRNIPYSTLLCYDLRFPEVFRFAAHSASLLIVPANWLSLRHEQFEILLRARAIENQVYVLGINCVGQQGKHTFLGGSCLLNPEGQLLLQGGEKAELLCFDFVDDTANYRCSFPCQMDARLSWYGAQYCKMETKSTVQRGTVS